MDRKTLPCLQNASQHVPVYLQQLHSYSNHNCKKSPFLHTPAFIFCLPCGRPCGNRAKHCMNEKTIQCLPNPSQHLSSLVSESYAQVQKPLFLPQFCFPWRRPWDNHAKCCMDGKRIRCLQVISLHVPI